MVVAHHRVLQWNLNRASRVGGQGHVPQNRWMVPTRCDWPPRVKGIAASNLSCNMRHSLAEALPQCSVTLHHVAHCDGSGGGDCRGASGDGVGVTTTTRPKKRRILYPTSSSSMSVKCSR